MALRTCPSGNADDIVHTLPLLHMTQRDWFDNDEFEPEISRQQPEQPTATNHESSVNLIMDRTADADPILVDSIRSSLEKLRFIDLRETLKGRGLKSTGSKEELQHRLFQSFLNELV
jgi:hypothetical protein